MKAIQYVVATEEGYEPIEPKKRLFQKKSLFSSIILEGQVDIQVIFLYTKEWKKLGVGQKKGRVRNRLIRKRQRQLEKLKQILEEPCVWSTGAKELLQQWEPNQIPFVEPAEDLLEPALALLQEACPKMEERCMERLWIWDQWPREKEVEEFLWNSIPCLQYTNELYLFTKKERDYYDWLYALEEETGLMGEVFYSTREWENTLIDSIQEKNQGKRCILILGEAKNLPVNIPRKTLLIGIGKEDRKLRKIALAKENISYISLETCLDTVWKSRYTDLVKDGIVNQTVKMDNN